MEKQAFKRTNMGGEFELSVSMCKNCDAVVIGEHVVT